MQQRKLILAVHQEDSTRLNRLLQDLLDWAERSQRQLQPGKQRADWEAAAARLLVAASGRLLAAGAQDLALRGLRFLPTWLRRSVAGLQQAQALAAQVRQEEMGATWQEPAPSNEHLLEQRTAYRVCCPLTYLSDANWAGCGM